jgi:pyruvate,water dikinase
MSLVLSLHDISDKHRPLVGGKGFALATMIQRNMAVPHALCVTTEAYHHYLASGGLRERIAMELSRKAFAKMRWEELWDTSLRLQNLFLHSPFPTELYEALFDPVSQIFGDKAVVVRSSAPGEDTAQSSFAGLHESYVNIKGAEAILDHIRLVWASLWSDRALLYRQELNLDVKESAMAVVVQEIRVGDRSGVVFGKNPNDPSQAVIEAVYGLNQGLVDGTVQPDRWILDGENGRLISHLPADKRKALLPSAGGLALQELPSEGADRPPLSRDEVVRVFELSLEAKALFHGPQDVEWTFHQDVLYVLQSRPVTSALPSANGDKRPWYLSLKKSFETLKALRKRIEEELIPQMDKEGKRLATCDPGLLPDVELAREIEERMDIYQKWMRVYEEEYIPMAHGIRLFGQVYNHTVRPSDPYEFMTLLGATEMVSLRRNSMLEDLAAMIRGNPDLAERLKKGGTAPEDKDFHEGLSQFTDAFGDLSCGTDQCVSGQGAMVKLLLEMAIRPAAKQAVTRKDFQELKEIFLSGFQADQRGYGEELLDLGRASYRLRDDDNIYLGRIKRQLDLAVAEGRTRLKRGKDATDDADGNSLAASLKAFENLFQMPAAPASPTRGLPSIVRQIVGQPAGPGIGRGRARVILEPSHLLDFQAGEILVCDALDPTMTFVVPLSEGIVERRGGMLIHGAIIAREYGLPCVTGVPEAAAVIRTGTEITVDGYLGIVTIHRENKKALH